MHKSSNQKNMIDVQYSNSMNAKILLEKKKISRNDSRTKKTGGDESILSL